MNQKDLKGQILKAYKYDQIIQNLSKNLTSSRYEKLRRCAELRTVHFIPMLENIHDTGNINAVMRTAENFGFQQLENIPSLKLKHSTRITRGAEKWVDFRNWKQTRDCLDFYKNQNYQIAATTLTDRSIDFKQLDYSLPTVMIFGNEKKGVSKETLKLCDFHCQIKTVGLCESFNISVAAAIILSHVREIIDQKKLYLDQHAKKKLLSRYLLSHFKDSTLLETFDL